MTITWAKLEAWMEGKHWRLPAGFKLEYEFRPSLSWDLSTSIHTVHEYWKQFNDESAGSFWHLEREEQNEWKDKYLQARYRVFSKRPHTSCLWQKFTLTDINGKQIVLIMDRQGSVKFYQPAKRTETYDVLERIS